VRFTQELILDTMPTIQSVSRDYSTSITQLYPPSDPLVLTMAPIKSILSKFTTAAFAIQPQNHHRSTHVITAATSEESAIQSLSDLCNLFDITPSNHLYLSTSPFERGVFVNVPVSKGDIILSIPITNCFRDDQPPDWFEHFTEDDDVTDYERYDPSAWAIRLAASLIDMDLDRDKDVSANVKRGRTIWKSLLPDKDMLRASLPVHWNEELLASAKCTELEVAVDNAFFSRGNAVMAIADKLGLFLKETTGNFDEEQLKFMCEDALDMVRHNPI
jgi:hypothetical protein